MGFYLLAILIPWKNPHSKLYYIFLSQGNCELLIDWPYAYPPYRTMEIYLMFKGCDSNLEVNIFQMLKVATNETSTLK